MWIIVFRPRFYFLDRLALRLFTSPYGFHLIFSGFTALLAFGCLIATWNLSQALLLPGTLKSEGRIIEAALVNRSDWRWNREHSVLQCYVQVPDEVLPCNIFEDPGSAKTLKIYRHELLRKSDHRQARAVMVPADGSWDSIFRSAEGESVRSKVAFVAIAWTATSLCLYVAFRGYVLLRRGGRSSQRSGRHRQSSSR